MLKRSTKFLGKWRCQVECDPATYQIDVDWSPGIPPRDAILAMLPEYKAFMLAWISDLAVSQGRAIGYTIPTDDLSGLKLVTATPDGAIKYDVD